jgi:hypothetical protein
MIVQCVISTSTAVSQAVIVPSKVLPILTENQILKQMFVVMQNKISSMRSFGKLKHKFPVKLAFKNKGPEGAVQNIQPCIYNCMCAC